VIAFDFEGLVEFNFIRSVLSNLECCRSWLALYIHL